MTGRFVRYRDLKERGLINNRVTLGRWIESGGFPPPLKIGPNTVVWPEHEIDEWLATRERRHTNITVEA
jgi:predicted DNA-binding transcriptional regulator AlpA